MIDSIRSRLTLWHVSVLAGVLIAFGLGIYALMTTSLHNRVDADLRSMVGITLTSLTHDAAEGQSLQDAAQSTVAELSSARQPLAIFDGAGVRLAANGWDDEFEPTLPDAQIQGDDIHFFTGTERDHDDPVRIAVRRINVPPDRAYIVMAGEPLGVVEDELEALRTILAYSVPIALVIAGIGGSLLARKSLAPVVAMAERAGRLGAGNLGGRLPVGNPRDELGRLAETFNDLLGRLSVAFQQQQRFMADASHELRTPVATTRTAAAVTLQRPHRDEAEYREALKIVEDQADRLARIVDDMLTLARADAGEYPVRADQVYLNELIEEVARDARVLAGDSGVNIDVDVDGDTPVVGDEHLLKRLVTNLLDNAIRHSPAGSTVRIALTREAGRCVITVADNGPGIPAEAQPHIFERFYRADAARTRREDRGAGLGLAIAKWIAEAHHGALELVGSSAAGTIVRASLPA